MQRGWTDAAIKALSHIASIILASTEDTAKALGVSEEAVKTRLHRARLWLRERLTAYFTPYVPEAHET